MTPNPDRDWWAPRVAIAAFVVLVAAMLEVVPGWSAPLRAWITLGASLVVALAFHAAVRVVAAVWRRHWGAVLPSLLLALGLGVAGLALLMLGHWSRSTNDDAFVDEPVRHGPSR